jgi:tungstate transport system substrate-binding protein
LKRLIKPVLKTLLVTVVILGLISSLFGCGSTTTPTTTTTQLTTTTTKTAATTTTITSTTNVPTSTTTSTTTVTTSTITGPLIKPANPEIILSSTTSTRDSGLMDVLIPIFEAKTGYVVKPIYNGSGAAMALGQQGNADVLLVHSPAAEITFMAGGYGIFRRLVMHNDFIIMGPPSDPAGISGMSDPVAAFKKIAAAKASFYSRGDNSGTDAMDKSLFAKAGITVKDSAATNPSWYIEGGAGTGMLDLLRIASEKGGYILTDRSTYVANQKLLTLNIMVQGDPSLLNVYHVIQVNPAKFPNVNAAGAQAFSDFMVDPDTQKIIAQYGIAQYGQELFFPDFGKTEAQLGSQ